MKFLKFAFFSFALILLLTGLFASPGSNQTRPFTSLDNPTTEQELGNKVESISELSENFNHAVEQSVQEYQQRLKMQKEIEKHLTPANLVPKFFQQWERMSGQEKSRLLEKPNALRKTSAHTGSIRGKVTVAGEVPSFGIWIIAFDQHGYFAGADSVSDTTGEYEITSLRADSFYVVTRSSAYVDEIYDDVKAPLGIMNSWRMATKVGVSEGAVGNINFDLQEGAIISGNILKPDGTILDEEKVVQITITQAQSQRPLLTVSRRVTDGTYQISVPAIGHFKIAVKVEGYQKTWAYNKTSWHDASTFKIYTLDSVLSIDFTLVEKEAVPAGSIAGTVSPGIIAIAAAFNASDTTFAGFAFGFGFLQVSYEIENLPPGDYLVYGDDMFSTLIDADNHQGEFYDGNSGSYSVKGAKAVTVQDGHTTEDINFALDPGGAITGKITDANNSPLDSLLLIAVNKDVLHSGDEPLLSTLDIIPTHTKTDGTFKIPGLATGNYILRTVSDYKVQIDLTDLSNPLLPGKHKGKVVDEYYNDVPNVLRILDATPIPVTAPETVSNVNFQLGAAHFINGKVTDAQSGDPMNQVLIVAMEDTSAFPFIPVSIPDTTGVYKLGPLPEGQYKVLAVVDIRKNQTHLSEFYNGKRRFALADGVTLSTMFLNGIDFTLDRGAVVQGFIDLLPGESIFPAGTDTLSGFPVVLYDANTGEQASYNYVQFSGGFRVHGILPGDYKVMALPFQYGYAAAYAGGGSTFSQAGQTITVDYGDVQKINIELEKAGGTITGTVKDKDTNVPLAGVGVAAYDTSGHMTGVTLTGWNPMSGLISENVGEFTISGLHDGSYYVRTMAITSLLRRQDEWSSLLNQFNVSDPMELLTGSFGSIDLSLDLYTDYWYEDAPAPMNIDPEDLAWKASRFGLMHEEETSLLPVYLPIPFYDIVPDTAQLVTIENGKASTTLEFALPEGIAVEDTSSEEDSVISAIALENVLPREVALRQNYPNPFNPATTIDFALPQSAKVKLTVYDATGRQVAVLRNAKLPAGHHSVRWNGRSAAGQQVAAGIYFARLIVEDSTIRTIKMLMIK